jgi:hypothetical protein
MLREVHWERGAAVGLTPVKAGLGYSAGTFDAGRLDLPLVETAELLRVPLGTVKSRLERGLTLLRGCSS